MTIFTYPITSPLQKLSTRLHKHYWSLTLHDGRVVAVCDCGAALEAHEIENILNTAEQ